MESFLAYIIKSAVSFSVLFVPFLLLYRRNKSFAMNRFFLLLSMAGSLLLPLLDYSLPRWMPVHVEQNLGISSVMVTQAESQTEPFSWIMLLPYIYIIGVVLALLWHIYGLLALHRTIKKQTTFVTYIDQGAELRCMNGEGGSFSWMNTIVMSQEDMLENKDIIIQHELAHINLRHSYDKILMIFMQIVQWFNPLVWLIGDVMNELHEYQADELVLMCGANRKNYQMLLIRKISSPVQLQLVNGLNMKDVKTRIQMMNTKKKALVSAIHHAALLPVLFFVVMLSASYSPPRFFGQPYDPTTEEAILQQKNETISETIAPKQKDKREIKHSEAIQDPLPVEVEVKAEEPSSPLTTEELHVIMMNNRRGPQAVRYNQHDVMKSILEDYFQEKETE